MEILEKVTITYNGGLEEKFDAIRITNKGVIICRILDGDFIDYGFIPNYNIKEINNTKGKIFL